MKNFMMNLRSKWRELSVYTQFAIGLFLLPLTIVLFIFMGAGAVGAIIIDVIFDTEEKCKGG